MATLDQLRSMLQQLQDGQVSLKAVLREFIDAQTAYNARFTEFLDRMEARLTKIENKNIPSVQLRSTPPPPPSTPAPDSPPPGWNPELVAAIVRDLTPPTVEDTPVIVEPTATTNGGDHHAIPMEHYSTLGIRNFSLATPTLANAVLLILVNLPIVLFAAMHLLLVKSAGIAQFPFDPGGRW